MAEAAAPRSPDRDWWLRAVYVLQAPRAVFAALRDDAEAAADARQEPALALLVLAGIAAVLSSGAAAHLLDDPAYDGMLIVVWAFFAGSLYGATAYWLGGLVLHFGMLVLGSRGGYRRHRHLLAFAAAPIALSLVLWAPRLALYGGDSFRYAGADEGTGGAVFEWLQVAFFLWALALLVLGIRALERWSWGRSLSAAAVAAVLPVVIALGASGLA
ncbi:MAG TPA: YIP1 family protein [Gaiellaceae bacterium]|jgi:hypothetical protein|nr:YIP1 family protein [Gaiellaceae bacterium]